MQQEQIYMAGLYLRLSKDDENKGESVSIGTQRAILTDFCVANHYSIHKYYIDDGYSGLNFERPGFQELLEDVERGLVNMVITKDLSRLGRDYIMTGYYSEIFFQTKGAAILPLRMTLIPTKAATKLLPLRTFSMICMPEISPRQSEMPSVRGLSRGFLSAARRLMVIRRIHVTETS